MSAEYLLDQLAEAGATVEAVESRLIVRAGPRGVPGELVRQIAQAKAEILAQLAPAWWRRQYLVRRIARELGGTRSRNDASHLAWGELECRWHRLYGERTPASQCAGCGAPMDGVATLETGDGNRVHFDEGRGLDCLIDYGRHWRGAATRALAAMGLKPPLNE